MTKKILPGYSNPPQNTQFKPGQSGNPKGRPKGIMNTMTFLEKELNSTIYINENGRRIRISKKQAILKQYINQAIKGDFRHFSHLFPHLLDIDKNSLETKQLKINKQEMEEQMRDVLNMIMVDIGEKPRY